MPVGGIRARLIADSFYETVRGSLEQLGWFDVNRRHRPVTLITRPNDWDESVETNAIAITCEDSTDISIELGSGLTEDRWEFSVDLYAEDDDVGVHLTNDVRDILRGKLPSIGRTGPVFSVYDYRQATPPILFTCEIERVVVDRAHGFTKLWQQHWWAVRCDVIDAYDSNDDD